MSFIDYIFNTYASVKQDLLASMGYTSFAACRLYSSEGKEILIADDGSMASVIELRGNNKLIGEEEFENIVKRLETVLKTPLSKKSHAIQFVFSYDPTTVLNEIVESMQPIHEQAKMFRMNIKDVLDDSARTLASYCASERCYIIIWTRPNILTKAELKQIRKAIGKQRHGAVDGMTQNTNRKITRIRDIHLAVLKNVDAIFSALNYKNQILDNHEAIRQIRMSVLPSKTAKEWKPVLFGDPIPKRCKDIGKSDFDVSNIFPPTVASQIWNATAYSEKSYIEIDDYIFAPFVMRLPPQTIMPYNTLFQSMAGEGMPWRMSILVTGDGMEGMGMKNMLAGIFAFSSMNNRQYNLNMKEMKHLQEEGDCIVGFQAAFTTWVNRHTPNAKEILSQRASRLATSVQSWGSCDTTDLVGDPLLALSATVPASMPVSPAPKAAAPLLDVLQLLPIMRPCSPFNDTNMPMRTPDGKFMPIGIMHSSMASWNEIAFAPMGSGKSFFLNTENLYYVLRPGQKELPWLTIIDIGVSSSGVINLIKSALPENERHLATFARLRNTAAAAINPLDTPLGCWYPLPSHLDYLVNLLSLLCTPLDKSAPVDGISGIIRESLDRAYKTLAPTGENPKRYDHFEEPQIEKKIKELGIECDQNTTWWEIVEALFDEGEYHLAVCAQRHATPVLTDIAVQCQTPIIASQYENIKTESGEPIPHACSRYLTGAVRDYPILSNPTKFDIGAARIVALDLQEVTPRSGAQAERMAGIMYMTARYIGAGHFFNILEDLDLIPEKYKEYHRPRFESLAYAPKRLCYDEFHRASCADLSNPLSKQILTDLSTASRESRKRNLSIGLYSQDINDFPPELVNLATSIFVLGAGSAQSASEIQQRFGLNNAATLQIRRISKPTKAGANFVGIFRTASGESVQYLSNCVGSYAKWAFSTTAEDMRIRNTLYEKYDCMTALGMLCLSYPDGSIKAEIEKRSQKIKSRDGEIADDIIQEIMQEIIKKSGNS